MSAFSFPRQDVQIDGHTFEIPVLDALVGRRLVVKLMNALAPALAQATKQDGKEAQGAALIGTALEGLTPELLGEFCDAFGSQSRVDVGDGKRPLVKDVFSSLFAGKYSLMFKWLFECCRANFADFLADGALTSALQAAAKPSR